ncbi:MAG: hypothetical protein EP329_21040 [Deltaproteobacteria bacterium]|nr:MAG: hypothetical protein EP329_21040 [Deltaproteobacteria bacterium]
MTYPDLDPSAPDARDPADGARLSDADVAGRLADVRCIYVAEQHAVPAYHAVQRAVLERLARAGRSVVVGVEWLPASSREIVETWLAGDEPVEALAAALDWEHRWGHDFAAYAPIFAWARAHRVDVVPVNAERGLAREVARTPLAELSEETRAALPPLDTGNPRHRALFDAMMHAAMSGHGGHALPALVLDRYYMAQLVWDETMSRNVATLLTDPAHPDRAVVVFAGLGHIRFGLGVPQRVLALTGQPYAIVLPTPADALDAQAWTGATAYPDREADILWVVP